MSKTFAALGSVLGYPHAHVRHTAYARSLQNERDERDERDERNERNDPARVTFPARATATLHLRERHTPQHRGARFRAAQRLRHGRQTPRFRIQRDLLPHAPRVPPYRD